MSESLTIATNLWFILISPLVLYFTFVKLASLIVRIFRF